LTEALSAGISQLPDPRRWNKLGSDDPLLHLTLASQSGDPAARRRLSDELQACIRQGRDDAIFAALRLTPSAVIYRHLWEQAGAAADRPQSGAGSVVARLFAIPVVLVTGAKSRITLPGIVPDIGEISALLETHGAVGATRNFGLNNALSSLQTLERITPSQVHRWADDFTASGMPREIGAEAIEVAPGREQVQLRFLIGVGIAPRAAPSFLETAANIGAWGMPLTRLLATQLARPGLDLLPVPRPLTAILSAAHAGRCAQLELAFNLFVSNTVRQFRSAVGDPTVVLTAHQGEAGVAEIRISMSSALDDTLLEGFRWPLHPLDDLGQIVGSITALLEECRIGDIRLIGTVVAGNESSGRSPFIRAAAFDRTQRDAQPH